MDENGRLDWIIDCVFTISYRYLCIQATWLIPGQVKFPWVYFKMEEWNFIHFPVSLNLLVKNKLQEPMQTSCMQQIQRSFRPKLREGTDDSLELRGHQIIVVFKHHRTWLIVQEGVDHHDQCGQLLCQTLHLVDFSMLVWGEDRCRLILEWPQLDCRWCVDGGRLNQVALSWSDEVVELRHGFNIP